MRDIEFRGKTTDKFPKWVYGCYISFEELPARILCQEFIDVPNGNIQNHEVEPKSVGQYTIMKDSKGNKIYEGDILRLTMPDGSIRLFVVEWAEEDRKLMPLGGFEHDGNPVRISGWCFNWKGFRLYPTVIDGISDNEKMTIVGNVHDNPELLSDESKE